jgi:hypothetical protein
LSLTGLHKKIKNQKRKKEKKKKMGVFGIEIGLPKVSYAGGSSYRLLKMICIALDGIVIGRDLERAVVCALPFL